VSFPPSVPEGFARTQVSLRGEAGLTWLNRLPTITDELADSWSLRVGGPFPNLSYNWVVPALREDGAPAVLKLSFPGDEEFESRPRRWRPSAGGASVACWSSTSAGARYFLSACNLAGRWPPSGTTKRRPRWPPA
jgi:hypothetical protein